MPFIEPLLILSPLSFLWIAFAAYGRSGIDNQRVVIWDARWSKIEHADFEMPAGHADALRESG